MNRSMSFWLIRTAVAIPAAILGNAIVYMLGTSLGVSFIVPQGPAGPQPLTLMQIGMVTFLAGVGASLVYAALLRWVRKPVLTFRVVSAIVLVLSFGATLAVPMETSTALALDAMHVVAAALLVFVLTVRYPSGQSATR